MVQGGEGGNSSEGGQWMEGGYGSGKGTFVVLTTCKLPAS